MTTEQWRPIPGWEGYYEVSDQGRVQRSAYTWTAGKGSSRSVAAGLVSAWTTPGGYRSVELRRNGRRRAAAVHTLVMEAFVGPRPDGQEVRHLDGDALHNSLTNLAYGTPRENALDTIRHGNHRKVAITHCPQGHEYSPENTLRRRNGHRVCRECNRQRGARYYRAKTTAAA